MKKKAFFKKIIAYLAIICMTFQLLPISAEAAEIATSATFESMGLKISFNVTSSWDGGYNAEVKINNPSSEKYEDWALEVTAGDSISSIWNATILEETDGKYLIDNAGYNQDINAGSTVTFGYSAGCSFSEVPQIVAVKRDYVPVAESDYKVDYSLVSDWGTGATASLILTNLSDSEINEWRLTFDYGTEIKNIWSASVISHENEKYVISGCDYNQNLTKNSSISIGFNTDNAKDIKPSEFILEKYSFVTDEDDINTEDDETDEPSTDDEIYFDGIEIFSSKSEVYIDGKSESVYIYAYCEKDYGVIELYEQNLGLMGEFKDDGLFNYSGDDMSGDGVYTYLYTIPASTKMDQKLVFTAKAGDVISNEVNLDIYVPFSDEEEEEMAYVRNAIKEAAESQSSNQNESVIKACEALLSEGSIKAYKVLANGSIEIWYNSGISFTVIFGGFGPDSLGTSKRIYQINNDQTAYLNDNIYKITNASGGAIERMQYLDPVQISAGQSVKLSIFNTCAPDTYLKDASIAQETDRDEIISSLISSLHDIGITTNEYTRADIDTLRNNMSGSDIIMIWGHGGVDLESGLPGIFVTNNYQDGLYDHLFKSERIKYTLFVPPISPMEPFPDNYLSFDTYNSYLLLPKFFDSETVGSLDNSFVSIMACSSYGTNASPNSALADAICESGANSVTSFKNDVDSDYAYTVSFAYVEALVARASSQEAYDWATTVCGDSWNQNLTTEPAYFMLTGGKQSGAVPTKLVNGNFEASNKYPKGWDCAGDVQIKAMLGPVHARNRFMAFMSTGIGSSEGVALQGTNGQQGSMMSQRVLCKGNELLFYYDVFSEEPSEWIGSSFDDKFILQVRDSSGQILFNRTLESVNSSSWIPTEQPNFDGGDNTTYHTGLKGVGFVLPPSCMNKLIDICFIVCDVGDSAYDTAVVIDDVVLQ